MFNESRIVRSEGGCVTVTEFNVDKTTKELLYS